MAALPTFIPLPDAAQKMGITEARLKKLISAGRLNAVKVNGTIVVSEAGLPKRKEDLPEFKKFAHLAGRRIWMSAASRKYKLTLSMISNWANKGIIKNVIKEGNKVLLDEQEVAYCSEIYHRDPGQGKRPFNADGTPYEPKQA